MDENHDPRVFFAAERTLLAWVRTGATAIGLGFMVARFGLFLRYLAHDPALGAKEGASTAIGVLLVVVGSLLCLLSALQFRRFAAALRPADLPHPYSHGLPVWTGVAFAAIGLLLAGYLFW
ncbi:MAG: DUF202 domain-containing protein [Planctomycetes bacterium]|nr:DUF202 domain-containing protein [Planctomycetota bacterium]